MQKSVSLSVVILTKNVEAHLADCLRSVQWASELIVVDYGSSDKTLEIARAHGVTLYRDSWDNEGAIRNRAYARATQDWVFTLDADERVSDELRDEIIARLSAPTSYNAFSLPIKNIYAQTYWIRHGGWYPGYKVRIFRKGKFWYEEAEIHPRISLDGKDGRLKGDILHYFCNDFTHLLNKLNVQSSLEAAKWLRDGRKMNLSIACARMFSRFFKGYIQKQGFRDGFIGLMITWFNVSYQLLAYAKYWQAKRLGKTNELEKMTLSYTVKKNG
ncbi:MAG: glycosyltransferase family 2 protein [Candidatus Omnitrophica bacterium]|nr:glycosyltransferase family 2 protein [Candidatus Omnitrophota bacterium]